MELAQTEEPIFLDYSLDELLLDLTGINGEIKQASAAEKKLKAKKRFIEEQIRYAMRQQGISKAGNDSCTVNVKTETHYRPDPESWEEFLAWIYENEYLHLLKRDFNKPHPMQKITDTLVNILTTPDGKKLTEIHYNRIVKTVKAVVKPPKPEPKQIPSTELKPTPSQTKANPYSRIEAHKSPLLQF